MAMMDWKIIISEYVCPSLGCFIASAVFAAPIHDLSKALKLGSLGNLNTVPWSIMTGNCLGWCSYAYCTNDPFVLAANLPGLILSFWLNIGAAKLQYLKQIQNNDTKTIRSNNNNNNNNNDVEFEDENNENNDNNNNSNNNNNRNRNKNNNNADADADNIRRRIVNNFNNHSNITDTNTNTNTTASSRSSSSSSLTSTSQDVLFLRVISIWSIIIVCVGWLGILHGYEQKIVGILVNINLIFFYGAPLQTMKTVFETKSSNSIHTPTVTMNVINAIFWISYGLAKNDIIIYGPNGIGLLLGITQGTLCLIYSSSSSSPSKHIEEEVAFELKPLPYRDDAEPNGQELFTNDRDFVSSTSSSLVLDHSLNNETVIT